MICQRCDLPGPHRSVWDCIQASKALKPPVEAETRQGQLPGMASRPQGSPATQSKGAKRTPSTPKGAKCATAPRTKVIRRKVSDYQPEVSQ